MVLASDLFSVCLRTTITDHINLKLWIFIGHTASFKIEIGKVQDLGNYELSPMQSDLGVYCLKYRLLKYINGQKSR